MLVDPAEARVYVDGYYAGVVDDFDGLFQRLHVSPGRHEITLKLEGYTSHRMRVYVGPDATLKLHYDMQKGSGETFEDLSGGRAAARARGAPRARSATTRTRSRRPRSRRPRPTSGRAGCDLQRPARRTPRSTSTARSAAPAARPERCGSRPGRHRIEVVRPGYRTVGAARSRSRRARPTQLSVTLERPSI